MSFGASFKKDKKSTSYRYVRLASNLDIEFNTGDNILAECPLDALNKQLETKFTAQFKPSAVITSWFKNNVKLTQFSLEDDSTSNGRVQLFQRKLKIKRLAMSDSGIYRCELITGAGLSVKSDNLTVRIKDNAKSLGNLSDMDYYDDYDSQLVEIKKIDPVLNLNDYVKGG